MAKFINTRKAVSALEDLIRDAGQRLILISPYLKVAKDFKELLEYRNNKEKLTTIVFGKQELKPEEMHFLQGLRFVILKFNENLHAKCYVNDDKMLITSLNLYEFSMANNKEMGVIIDKNDPADAQLFQDAMTEVEFIQETSQRFEFSARPEQAITLPTAHVQPAAPHGKRMQSEHEHSVKAMGYCIRTGVPIPFNIEKPMSYGAYKQWMAEGGDPDASQTFCHFSGEPSEGTTSVNRPILRKHWKKAQEAHGL